ncbi:1-(5-phosphoribosyl)-5-[(5-phosphoribosylamino)methylideneamino]imidazole-4-carboxamide isomerase [Lignipirellula cremea]|uniref:1-(5-phosphoribosyl)-5-[(5-phosphoribosylamino)methylideneamino] imidazole-4-carboxamide isomerase n=1 Tax=Lignipirellula cremea TaxID=2528010 RepID=A0A518E346_9BACT|nr:1-(5-phosphoribosyl)-5-[(5-phosphoribosylamino)methylideneamino]imidazole-4-carboxamide isomerase [Lignipirellula cremea]QDU98508.1 1-(5-phosphoribosyl)-5-[(5-phosphoribosylamino)methylideneamino] imidazole-4-carboxamide isomerase [Lignipirellula cremea]
MEIWPAIDLRGGKCVRLAQGDYNRETVFGENPVEMAVKFVEQGARHLHLVDLDGARDGKRVNNAAVAAIVSAIDIPCELGGGVRDEQAIEELLALGLSRLVIGTRALKDPDWFVEMCRKYPGQLSAGIDARNGKVATEGWLETSDTPAVLLAQKYAGEPIASIIYTDIAKDGMMAGPNLEAMVEMRGATAIPVIASGGVTTNDDVERLAAAGMHGAIIGRALYEGTITLPSALAAAARGDEQASR